MSTTSSRKRARRARVRQPHAMMVLATGSRGGRRRPTARGCRETGNLPTLGGHGSDRAGSGRATRLRSGNRTHMTAPRVQLGLEPFEDRVLSSRAGLGDPAPRTSGAWDPSPGAVRPGGERARGDSSGPGATHQGSDGRGASSTLDHSQPATRTEIVIVRLGVIANLDMLARGGANAVTSALRDMPTSSAVPGAPAASPALLAVVDSVSTGVDHLGFGPGPVSTGATTSSHGQRTDALAHGVGPEGAPARAQVWPGLVAVGSPTPSEGVPPPRIVPVAPEVVPCPDLPPAPATSPWDAAPIVVDVPAGLPILGLLGLDTATLEAGAWRVLERVAGAGPGPTEEEGVNRWFAAAVVLAGGAGGALWVNYRHRRGRVAGVLPCGILMRWGSEHDGRGD